VPSGRTCSISRTSVWEHLGQSMDLESSAKRHVSRSLRLHQRLIIEKSADVSAPPLSVFGPIRIPVGPMGAFCAAGLATTNHLFTHADMRF
jgi:hypothetical protein